MSTITVTEEGVLELYPKLSEFQATFLRDMADGFAPVLFLVVPDERDDPETLESRTRSNKEIEQLVEMGLLEDGNIHGQFDLRIQEYQQGYDGRQIRVFALTKLGREMFRRPFGKEDPIN